MGSTPRASRWPAARICSRPRSIRGIRPARAPGRGGRRPRASWWWSGGSAQGAKGRSLGAARACQVSAKWLEPRDRWRCNMRVSVPYPGNARVLMSGGCSMRLAIKVLAVILGLAVSTEVWAQGTGRSLDIQPGGRQNGMGAAGVALADDPTGATWWNPAALGFVGRSGVELTYAQLVPGLASDVNYNYLTFVHPTKGWGAFGLGVVFLSYGQSEGADDNGNPTGTFGSNEFSPALYYGTQILPDFSLGASLKYIRIQLAPSDLSGVGSTFGVDLAALYKVTPAHLNVGLNVQNLGPSVAF